MKLLFCVLLFSLCVLLVSGLTDEYRREVIQLAQKKGYNIPSNQKKFNSQYASAVKHLKKLNIALPKKKAKVEPPKESSSSSEEAAVDPSLTAASDPLKGTASSPRLPKTLGFFRESLVLLLTLVPYKVCLWAFSEVFPDSLLEHPTVQGVFEHEKIKSIKAFANSNFVILTVVIASLFLVPYFGLSSRLLWTVRHAMFALSFGLLLVALAEMTLTAIGKWVPENAKARFDAVAKVLDVIVFIATTILSYYLNIWARLTFSLLGSVVVFVGYHFYEDGSFHTDPRSFYHSTAATEARDLASAIKSGAQSVMNLRTSTANGTAVATGENNK